MSLSIKVINPFPEWGVMQILPLADGGQIGFKPVKILNWPTWGEYL